MPIAQLHVDPYSVNYWIMKEVCQSVSQSVSQSVVCIISRPLNTTYIGDEGGIEGSASKNGCLWKSVRV